MQFSSISSKVLQLGKNRGVQIFLLLFFYLILVPHLPEKAPQFFYSISLSIKEVLIWFLPFIVGLFIAHAISSFERKAPLFIAVLILFELFSNVSSVWYAYFAGHITTSFLTEVPLPAEADSFLPLWTFPFNKPLWWSADKGTLIGVLLGIMSMFFRKVKLGEKIERAKDIAQMVLTKFFSPLIPFFVLGFVARMQKTKMLSHMFAHYGFLLMLLLFYLSIYILFLFWLGSDKTPKSFLFHLKNVLPAGGLAFTSGCSLSTMPWTISGSAKNLEDPLLAESVIPATTNIQQIGDCIANTFLCFLIYRYFYGVNPDLSTWIFFSVVFVLARFATAAVIGGAIFIMLPIYESYLHFNTEMIAIILAFNVLLDPLITSSNVMANGALCRLFEKVWLKVTGKRAAESEA